MATRLTPDMLTEQLPKSTGHIAFLGDFEYFEYGASVFRAPINNPVFPDGMRAGARFECYSHMKDMCMSIARKQFAA